MATNDEQKTNIGAWDAMMANVAGRPEIERLQAEVDRLHAREQALQLQLDAMGSLLLDVQRDCIAARQEANAMRPMVEAVAEFSGVITEDGGLGCQYCERWIGPNLPHADDCTVLAARAFVAAHPATTAEGETESDGED